MSVFRKRGFSAHKQEAKKIEERKAKAGSNIWKFFLKDGEEDVPVRFLTEEPILFYEHTVQAGGKWETHTCIGAEKGCTYCESGNKASYKGAWLIVDGREFTYKKDGKDVTGKDQIRLYSRGSTDIGKLDRLSRKWGLTSRPWFATKTGSGTSTSYELDRGEESELTSSELANILAKLPEKYRNYADPDDMDTLYDIVEDCIFGDVIEDTTTSSKGSSRDDDDEEEDTDVDSGVRSTGTNKITPKKKIFKKR